MSKEYHLPIKQCAFIITRDRKSYPVPRRCGRGASFKGYCATHVRIIVDNQKLINQWNGL